MKRIIEFAILGFIGTFALISDLFQENLSVQKSEYEQIRREDK